MLDFDLLTNFMYAFLFSTRRNGVVLSGLIWRKFGSTPNNRPMYCNDNKMCAGTIIFQQHIASVFAKSAGVYDEHRKGSNTK
jgi:hypothetical protein